MARTPTQRIVTWALAATLGLHAPFGSEAASVADDELICVTMPETLGGTTYCVRLHIPG